MELRDVMASVAMLQQTLQQSQAQSATLAASTSMLRSASTLPPGGRLSSSSGRRSSEPRCVCNALQCYVSSCMAHGNTMCTWPRHQE